MNKDNNCQSPDQPTPLAFSGDAVHGGDVWGAARALCRPVPEILDLSASLNPMGPPPGLAEELTAGLNLLCHYPDRQAWELRRELCRVLNLGPDNLLPGNGSTALIRLIIRVLDVKPIVVLAPAFGEITRSLALTGRHFHYLLTKEQNGFAPTRQDLDQLWERDPSCVILSNPLTPSGGMVPAEDLDHLLEQAARRRAWVVLDEAFIDFADPAAAAWAPAKVREYNRLLVLRSMTKIFCLAGLRLGYLMAHQEAIATVSTLGEPWSVNTLAQRAGAFCLGQDEFLEQTRAQVALWRQAQAQSLEQLGLKVYPSQVNYLLTLLPAGGPNAAQVAAACAAQGVLVRDCANFAGCGERHLRLAVATPQDQKRLFAALAPALQQPPA